MTLPRTAADVLSEHVVFEVESIDRMYLNVYQPRLTYGAGVAGFFVAHRGNRYASTALMDPMTKTFVADIHHFIASHDLDLVHFDKGQRKDEVTAEKLAGFTEAQGILYVGRAQEKALVWRTQRRRNPSGGDYAWMVRASAFINHFYFYCLDADFGPFFLKFGTYFPYTAKLYPLTELLGVVTAQGLDPYHRRARCRTRDHDTRRTLNSYMDQRGAGTGHSSDTAPQPTSRCAFQSCVSVSPDCR